LFGHLAQRRAQIEALSETVSSNDARLKFLRDDTASLMREIDVAGGAVPLPGKPGGTRARLEFREVPVDTAVVEYWLGESRALAWLITRQGVRMFDLGATAAVESSARSLVASMHDWMNVPSSERLRRSRELQRLILAPLQAGLAHVRTIFFVPDGTLHAVPFAVLADGPPSAPRYLIDTHDVATAPALRGVTSPWKLRFDAGKALIVADPVYSRADARFSGPGVAPTPAAMLSMESGTLRGAGAWTRLPGSGREAADIAHLLSDRTDVEVLSGFDASREKILERDLGVYRILHFATHAVADTEAPQLSAIILSTFDARGRARIGELFAGELATQRMDAGLVVLSGCNTALGQASAGEGLLGMRYAAHASGARYVVASLWPVMDAAGSRLMRDMYRGIIDAKLPPVSALSRAMRTARSQWPDPALWGAYDVSSDADR
jgi:CHAT domain-containing protein